MKTLDTIKIWNTNDRSFNKTLRGHTASVHALAVLKNGDAQILKTTFQVQCSDCMLSVTEIEEVFDCTLSITSIEEVTGLAGNQGKLVTGITT